MPNSSEPCDFICHTLTIVGVGLIGGSLAAAVKQRGLARRVIGVGRHPEKLQGAIDRGWLDQATSDITQAARESDFLVFCTPVDRIVSGVRQIAEVCSCNTLITDAGSTKGQICDELSTGFPPGVEFIGSHPLAGSEKSGYEFADPNLFANRVCVLTPVERSSSGGLKRLADFWRGLGSRIVTMSPEAHDRGVAETSHFPHLAASALAATLSPENHDLAARGFRDTTRIAGGDADLWTSILLCNAESVCGSLDKYSEILQRYRTALQAGDANALRQLLDQGKQIREKLN
jgi:prephenate dehydrogenase